MNGIFLLSVILKGIGAVLEVLLQILITRSIGVDGFGTYSTWINTADIIFWVLFSALTKCNTFYLSVPNTSISNFKKKYYGRYVLPVLIGLSFVMIFVGKTNYCIVLLITLLELSVLDQSSTLLAQNHQMISLIGEYVFGRLVLVAGLLGLQVAGHLTQISLMILYVIQYLGIMLVFALLSRSRRQKTVDISDTVSLKKWRNYQRADLVQAMIGQMPVLLQFFFSGAFEAGVVSVVLTVKKLINFISGPSAKVFLPEFSRLYQSGRQNEIRACFASIMRIQMLFAGPLSVVLLGYPHVILRILADELVPYTSLFVMCSMVFLVVATFGPCSGVLQMTGNEKKDNMFREIALAVMFVVMWLFRKDSLFVLYGLCIQAFLEGAGKFYYVCRWMKKAPVKLTTYLSWWLCPVIVIGVTYWRHWEDSIAWMMISAIIVFAVGMISELKKEGGLRDMFRKRAE